MKILFFTGKSPDYLADVLYGGFCALLGEQNVIDFPIKASYHADRTRQSHCTTYNVPLKNPSTMEELLDLANGGYFEAILISSVRPQDYPPLNIFFSQLRVECPIGIIDGEDTADLALSQVSSMLGTHRITAYFKREYTADMTEYPDIIPLQFACIAAQMPPQEICRKRLYDVCWIGTFSSIERRRIVRVLEGLRHWRVFCDCSGGLGYDDYCRVLSQSRIVISARGAGYDTMRYWEAPYYGAMLLAEQPSILIPNDFQHGVTAAFFGSDLGDFADKIEFFLSEETIRAHIAKAGRKHLLRHHTARLRARAVLRVLRRSPQEAHSQGNHPPFWLPWLCASGAEQARFTNYVRATVNCAGNGSSPRVLSLSHLLGQYGAQEGNGFLVDVTDEGFSVVVNQSNRSLTKRYFSDPSKLLAAFDRDRADYLIIRECPRGNPQVVSDLSRLVRSGGVMTVIYPVANQATRDFSVADGGRNGDFVLPALTCAGRFMLTREEFFPPDTVARTFRRLPDTIGNDAAARLEEFLTCFAFPSQKPDVPVRNHGWFAEENQKIMTQICAQGIHLVVELGSWLGLSTRFLADLAPTGIIIAVDHWQGSVEHLANPEYRAWLPTLFETFLANCWDYRGRIAPVRMRTAEGLRLIAAFGLTPDLIYIDASQEYESVYADLKTAIELFPSAAIVGDDWPWPPVQRAVTDVVDVLKLSRTICSEGQCWWLESVGDVTT